MTTIVLSEGNLAADRMCTEYCNHLHETRKKIYLSDNGCVAIAIGGQVRYEHIYVKLANILEAMDWYDTQGTKAEGEEAVEYLEKAMTLCKKIPGLLDKDTLMLVWRSEGEVKMAYGQGEGAAADSLVLKNLMPDSYHTYGTGEEVAEFELRWQKEQGINDMAELFKSVSQVEECTSAEYDIIFGEDLNDIAELKPEQIKYEELIK